MHLLSMIFKGNVAFSMQNRKKYPAETFRCAGCKGIYCSFVFLAAVRLADVFLILPSLSTMAVRAGR